MHNFTTALALAAALFVTAGPVSAKNMTQDQIAKNLIGKTLTAKRKGMTVRLNYFPNGTMRLKAMIFSGRGTWQYSKDGLCMNMTSGPKKGETCVSFEHLGGDKYRNSEGLVLTAQD